MGRKLFLTHLADASHNPPKDIHDVLSLDDETVAFTYTYAASPFHKVNIKAYATDLDEYPDGNSFRLCTEDEFHEETIPYKLELLSNKAHGLLLVDLLTRVSESLTIALSTDSPNDHSMEDVSDPGAQGFEDFDFDLDDDIDDNFFGLSEYNSTNLTHASSMSHNSPSLEDINPEKVDKIRFDLKLVKNAGFRVGAYGNLATNGILCLSIRVSKLGLSDETLEAWSIPRKRYLVLLIRYHQGYFDAAAVVSRDYLSAPMQMKVGLCEHYKPSSRHAIDVFDPTIKTGFLGKQQTNPTAEHDHPFEALFIGKSLDQFMEERLLKIITARNNFDFSWLGAEKLIAEMQASVSGSSLKDSEPYLVDDSMKQLSLPAIVLADHMSQVPIAQASFPLIAMQFVLRHVVRCTEFCLVCHCRVDESYEAMKPYVCLKPLCLYQYMAFGFGPSLEWEILAQPYVVDLLVSFCYAGAAHARLKTLPLGMNLMVPKIPFPLGDESRQGEPSNQLYPPSFSCAWHLKSQYVEVKEDAAQNSEVPKLKYGDWVVLISREKKFGAHCQIKGIDLPQIYLDKPIFVPFDHRDPGFRDSPPDDIGDLSCAASGYLYNTNFDELSGQDQNTAIIDLLSTIPGVMDMRKHLERQGHSPDSSLRHIPRSIPHSALNLLQWIVASNRSCILQVDEIGEDDSLVHGRPEDRVSGMENWIQFRFAQGAPDKEKRFNDCVKTQAHITNTEYPTLFAWHGSGIGNWHSIIRQGLLYDEVVHGRAYGNGVYMSNNAQVSLGYCGVAYSRHRGVFGAVPGAVPHSLWKPSALKISTVLSLQEVVNHPEQFKSHNPHYVVANIDWIQTRYLFVKTDATPNSEKSLAGEYMQDPARLAWNEQRKPISIPLTAISKSRRPGCSIQTVANTPAKRAKTVCGTDQATAEQFQDDANSVISDAEDFALIAPPWPDSDVRSNETESERESMVSNDKKRHADDAPRTDFVPGKLDLDGIKFLDEPEDAAPSATKALMRLLKDALQTQESTPPEDLGWYITRDLVSNMYQWILELHSFPPDLPLAGDLKRAGLTSIVMELRFTSDFPFSPPFIRVVKPRFLPFSQGGGGNVTEGGAMCMEVLTNNGWTAGLSVENLLLQVRLVISDKERPARLARGSRHSSTYAIGEAIHAYVRACHAHGWTVPASFKSMQQ